jgi:hypothetical protein
MPQVIIISIGEQIFPACVINKLLTAPYFIILQWNKYPPEIRNIGTPDATQIRRSRGCNNHTLTHIAAPPLKNNFFQQIFEVKSPILAVLKV